MIGAVVYCQVGKLPSPDPRKWEITHHTSEVRVEVDLGVDVKPGSIVHVSACWVGPRLQLGPVAPPQQINVAGSVLASLAEMRIAA